MATGRIFPAPPREEPDPAGNRERKGRGSMRAAAPAMGWRRADLLQEGCSGGGLKGAGWVAGGGYKMVTRRIGFSSRWAYPLQRRKHRTTGLPSEPLGGQ